MEISKRPCLTKMGISTKMCNVIRKKITIKKFKICPARRLERGPVAWWASVDTQSVAQADRNSG